MNFSAMHKTMQQSKWSLHVGRSMNYFKVIKIFTTASKNNDTAFI